MGQPGVVPGAVLELHAARALGGLNPGVNSPLTTTWVDTAGANDGTLVNFTGSPWTGDGSLADPYRLVFAGDDDRVTVPHAAGLVFGSDFTVELWTKSLVAVGGWFWMAYKGAADTPNYGVEVMIAAQQTTGSSGWLRACVGPWFTDATTYSTVYDWSLSHHVVLTRVGGYCHLYVDGVEGDTGLANTQDLSTVTGRWNIGNGPHDTTTPLSGGLAFVRQYDVGLTATQVAQNYAAGPAWAPVVASDSINLEVAWTTFLTVNGGAEETYSRDVSVTFRAYSTAEAPDYPAWDFGGAGLVRYYRIRDTGGSWSSWAYAPVSGIADWGGQKTTVPLTLAGDGVRTVEVQWQDEDGNQWTASETIEVMPAGVLIGNAPPPQDVTNWRLLIGGRDFIDDCDGPPHFTLGEHGPGSLDAVLAVEDPMRKFANELVAGAAVDLWDGTLHLWDGKLKPVVAVSDDSSVLPLIAAGPLDLAKQDESVIWTAIDADPSHWFVSERASKAYTATTDGRIKVMHEKGRGVEGNYGAGIIYWANGGLEAQVIDHLEFGSSSIDVNSANWNAKVQVSDSPWGSWTTVRTWNNETASGAVRVPTTAGQSFAEAGYADVYAVKVILYHSTDLTAAESANNRWVELIDPQVFVATDVELRIDELMGAVAAGLGYPTQTETIGSALAGAAWPSDPTTWAAILDDLAGRSSAEVEWRWSDDTFYCRPKPTAPEYRHRWYVVDTRRCDWGVVTDEDARKDYVQVVYLVTEHATYPAGTRQALYRPSAPAGVFDRVGTLDLTELGPMTAANAQAAGDQWLLYNSAQAKGGSIGGFGGKLRTVDGQWVAASHARNGDWISALDLVNATDRAPIYITGVDVAGPDEVTITVGGAEREFAPSFAAWWRGGSADRGLSGKPSRMRTPSIPSHHGSK